jgi:hypothetical protein
MRGTYKCSRLACLCLHANWVGRGWLRENWRTGQPPDFEVVGVGVTVVVLTVGVDVAGVADDGAVDDVGVEVAVVPPDPPEKRGCWNSVHESRYSTVSPSETSNIVGDTA